MGGRFNAPSGCLVLRLEVSSMRSFNSSYPSSAFKPSRLLGMVLDVDRDEE